MSTRRGVPVEYEWPGADAIADSSTRLYWISQQADWTGATPQFMVMMADGDGQHIIAERCYRHHAVMIVDALRQALAGS